LKNANIEITIEPQDNANGKELAIHQLLDSIGVFKINISEFIKS
jgi:hypothetical protein